MPTESRRSAQARQPDGAHGVDGLRGPPGPENKSLVLRRDTRTAEGVPLDRFIVVKHIVSYLAKKTDGKGLWKSLLSDHGLEPTCVGCVCVCVCVSVCVCVCVCVRVCDCLFVSLSKYRSAGEFFFFFLACLYDYASKDTGR
jgi:hypothetical protein